ncbi:MAG: glycosyltransferase family 2 protein [Candidatus Sumerlaea chitinivorans]|nr:glycosyltransferase family 2 protein [Candidatus Sumerlaea chitinivorans]
MKLSVIIPVYNEVNTLATVLDAVRRVPLDKEIIVVDGNSTDGTREVLECEARKGDVIAIFQREKNGRGGALREGLAIATGDVVVFQDADLELDPACFPQLLAPIAAGECDVVLGSRFLAGRPQMTFLQYWGNRVINAVLNLFWGTRLTDVETCYQMFRRSVIADMEFERTDMSFSIELTLKLVRKGLRIREVPVSYRPRSRAEGKKLYWMDGVISLWVLVKYRFFSR